MEGRRRNQEKKEKNYNSFHKIELKTHGIACR